MKILHIDPIGGLAGDMLCAPRSWITRRGMALPTSPVDVPQPEISITSTLRGVFHAKHFANAIHRTQSN